MGADCDCLRETFPFYIAYLVPKLPLALLTNIAINNPTDVPAYFPPNKAHEMPLSLTT